MPTTNRRPRGPEADVAARVAMERERLGLSAAELARRMTTLGCTLNQSAINKIEQGQPPRRITVDEMVAFAKVFDLEIDDLLVPAHAARDREIELTYRRLKEAADHVDVMAGVCELQLAALDALSPLGSIVDLAGPCDDLRTALVAVGAAVASMSDDVRDRLRRQPAGLLEGPQRVAKNRSRNRNERAAQAASPPSRSRDAVAIQERRPRR